MLVEQKPSRDLITLWKSIKAKFDGNRAKAGFPAEQQTQQSMDFVNYIQSPDQKKALVSPIETLRSSEEKKTNSSSGSQRSSAFHPWSPTPQRRESSLRPNESATNSSSARFIYEQKSGGLQQQPPKHYTSHTPYAASTPQHSCGCSNNNGSTNLLTGSSPHYMGCQQCKTAAAATGSSGLNTNNCTGLAMLAQKASEIPGGASGQHQHVGDIKPKLEPGISTSNSCACDSCAHSQQHIRGGGNGPVHHLGGEHHSMERGIEDMLRSYISPQDNTLNTSIDALAATIASEFKRLTISQEDKLREFSVSNQRLQTELHLIKTEFTSKLNEACDTKAHLEQELELSRRERKNDIARYNQMTWEFTREFEKQKSHSGEKAEHQNALQREIRVLKVQLEQSRIDCENLHKQLTWTKYERSQSSSKRDSSSAMEVDSWTPFPYIGRKFSDSEDEETAEHKRKTVLQTSASAAAAHPQYHKAICENQHQQPQHRGSILHGTSAIANSSAHHESAARNTAEERKTPSPILDSRLEDDDAPSSPVIRMQSTKRKHEESRQIRQSQESTQQQKSSPSQESRHQQADRLVIDHKSSDSDEEIEVEQ